MDKWTQVALTWGKSAQYSTLVNAIYERYASVGIHEYSD